MDYTPIPDLPAHIGALLTEAPRPTRHVQGRALHADEHVEVLAFPFEAGQALGERTAPHPAVLTAS